MQHKFWARAAGNAPAHAEPALATPPAGDKMLESEAVRKIGFTGSTNVGKGLMAGAAQTVKKVSLELGGNAPYIIFDDADIELAATGVVSSAFRNAGQTCICANKILVQASTTFSMCELLTCSPIRVDHFCEVICDGRLHSCA